MILSLTPMTQLCRGYAWRMAGRVRSTARRYWRATEGAAAVEFALIVPMLSILFIGTVELSQVITINRRVGQIANATADLVGRASQTITSSDITDITNSGSYIMAPFNRTPLQIVLSNVTSSPSSATNTKQSWICTYSGTGNSLSCSCTNTAYTIPTNLVSTNDSVVIARVSYAYKPLVFDYFMKRNWTQTGGTYTLSQTAYQKPRSQAAMLMQSNNTPCPTPTFP